MKDSAFFPLMVSPSALPCTASRCVVPEAGDWRLLYLDCCSYQSVFCSYCMSRVRIYTINFFDSTDPNIYCFRTVYPGRKYGMRRRLVC